MIFTKEMRALFSLELTAEEKVELLQAIFSLGFDGKEIEDLSPKVGICLAVIKDKVKQSNKWYSVCKEAGKKGGELGKKYGKLGGRPRNGETKEEYYARRQGIEI